MNKPVTVLYICFMLLSISSLCFAAENTPIDNEYIHQYSGYIGKWELIESRDSLLVRTAKFGTTVEEVLDINGIKGNRVAYNYYFIPYSIEYLEKVKEKGRDRITVKSDINGFVWPTEGIGRITSVLGYRNNKFHPGLDIPAAKGMPIVASMEGVVTFSGYASGYGRCIVLKHRNNFITRYSHNSVNFVKIGEFIKKGQIIGLIGSTGHSTGNHLHFEIRCNDIPLDPLDFLPKNDDLQIIHTLKNWK